MSPALRDRLGARLAMGLGTPAAPTPYGSGRKSRRLPPGLAGAAVLQHHGMGGTGLTTPERATGDGRPARPPKMRTGQEVVGIHVDASPRGGRG